MRFISLFPRSAWERTACDAPASRAGIGPTSALDAERQGQWVPTRSVGTRNVGRPGFTLVEMLCVFALLALLSSILTLIILGTLEIERTQAAGFDRLLQNQSLAEQFRADVSAAADAPAQWQGHRADEHRLILHMKTGAHVIYAWRDKTLRRQVYADKQSSEATLPVGGANVDVEFVPADSTVKLVRLRLHTLRKDKRAEGESLEIAAALGGDWR